MHQPAVNLLAAPRLTLAGFGVLAVALLVPGAPVWPPLVLLALNLAAAIVLTPALRRGGLGVFHLALLALLLLAGYGRLVHFDARVEVTEQTEFDPALVDVTAQGPLHGGAWRGLQFLQQAWQVDYAPGMRRGHTRSDVLLPGERAPRTVGDDTPLVLSGYRFYSTHNKGFAPLLEWQPEGGAAVRGVLHLPSYPLFDWKQENDWRAPDGTLLKFRLRIEQAPSGETAFTLDPHQVNAVLLVDTGSGRHELRPGDTLRVGAATLRYENLMGWMGYRIFYDPTLLPMLAAALVGVLGLAWHLWGRPARLAPVRQGAAA